MTSTAVTGPQHPALKPTVLLLCGILSFLVYFITDIVASMLHSGYSIASQAISELFVA